MQVTCPTCQTVMVVPHAQTAAAPAAPPGKYSKAPSHSQHHPPPPGAPPPGRPRRKKKVNYTLYAQLAGGAAAIIAAIYFGPQLMEKYQHHKAEVAAAEMARTNPPPPPPPPDLGAEEILQKVAQFYKSIPSYSAHGESTANMDMSQVNPALKQPVESTGTFSILLGRPNFYRMEWERETGPQTVKGSAWSAGKGDFVQNAGAVTRVKNREMAFKLAAQYSGTMGIYLASSFFDETNGIATALKDFSKTNNETINGHKCYVLTGDVGHQKALLWIHKDDYIIAQAELILGGKFSEADLAGLNGVQKRQAERASKMRGNIMETYDDIETNRQVNAQDFQTSLASLPHANKTPKRAAERAAGRTQPPPR
jgi:outer membrane lipoprotein-sorting protein